MQKNVTLLGGSASELNGLTTASKVCSEDGDSGGTFVTPSGEVQGTLTGGEGCPESVNPDPADISYFQPVTTTLDRFHKTMLTTHWRQRADHPRLCLPISTRLVRRSVLLPLRPF